MTHIPDPLPVRSFGQMIEAIEQFEHDVRAAFLDLLKWVIMRIWHVGR